MNQQKEKTLHEHLKKLVDLDNLPLAQLAIGKHYFRVQDVRYTEGVHYGVPTHENMGRFNDPNGSVAVCYFSSSPVVALAETLLRLGTDEIGLNELPGWGMATLELIKNVSVIDFSYLLPHIRTKLDEVSGFDYEVCQAVVSYFSLNPHPMVQGIQYHSRHLPSEPCYALFLPAQNGKAEVSEHHLKTVTVTPLPNFICPLTSQDVDELLIFRLSVEIVNT